MMIEYATTTRSNDGTIDCVGQLTGRTYKNVEFIEPSMVDNPPIVGEVGIIAEIHNDEVVWFGRLKQFKTSSAPKELRLRPGESTGILFSGIDSSTSETSLYKATISNTGIGTNTEYTYTISEEVSIKNDGTIVLQRKNPLTSITTSKIELDNTDKITVSNDNFTLTINASGALTINANSTINVTAPLINLN